MIRLFRSDTDIKYLWIFASNLETDEKMRNNSEIIYHAKKMITSIDKMILFLQTDPGSLAFPDQIDFVLMGQRYPINQLKKNF